VGVSASMSRDGAYAAVGADGFSGNTGQVFIYNVTSSGWAVQAALSAAGGTNGDYFGIAVSVETAHTWRWERTRAAEAPVLRTSLPGGLALRGASRVAR